MVGHASRSAVALHLVNDGCNAGLHYVGTPYDTSRLGMDSIWEREEQRRLMAYIVIDDLCVSSSALWPPTLNPEEIVSPYSGCQRP